MKIKTITLKKIPSKVDDHAKCSKDNDLRKCTWNVRIFYRVSTSAHWRMPSRNVGRHYWIGQGCKRLASCDVYYSWHVDKHEFRSGFGVNKKLRHLVSRFTPMNERIATILIRTKFYISLICAQAPTKEKDSVVKDAFYAKLDFLHDKCTAYDAKINLGDFNVKVGREGIFGSTVGQFSLHTNITSNGMKLIDYAAAPNMVLCSTKFQHLDIPHGCTPID